MKSLQLQAMHGKAVLEWLANTDQLRMELWKMTVYEFDYKLNKKAGKCILPKNIDTKEYSPNLI